MFFLLQYVDALLFNFLDHHSAFRLQVGLLYRRLSADSGTRNIDSCCVACFSLLCN